MSDNETKNPGLLDEEAISEEELAEAEALALALDDPERLFSEDEMPPEAELQMAAMMRWSDGNELPDEVGASVLEEILRRPVLVDEEATRPWWKIWMPVGAGLAMAAAALALWVAIGGSGTETIAGGEDATENTRSLARELPAPSLSLLRAQMAAARGENLENLDGEMREYRENLFAMLEAPR